MADIKLLDAQAADGDGTDVVCAPRAGLPWSPSQRYMAFVDEASVFTAGSIEVRGRTPSGVEFRPGSSTTLEPDGTGAGAAILEVPDECAVFAKRIGHAGSDSVTVLIRPMD